MDTKTIRQVLLSASCAIYISAVSATPPLQPVTIDISDKEISGKLNDSKFMLSLQLKKHNNFAGIEFSVTLVPINSFNVTKERKSLYREKISGRENKLRDMKIPLRSPEKPGDYEVHIKITGKIDKENGFSDNVIRYLRVDKNNQYRLIPPKQYVAEQRSLRQKRFENALKKDPTAPQIRLLHENSMKVPDGVVRKITPHMTKKQLSVRPTGPSDSIKKYIDQRSDKSWSAEDPITVRGRLTYFDYDGVWRPLVNVSVNLYDEDTGFDDHLGTTVTDWSGNWSFTVNNNDGWLADGRDIYYTFKLENTRIRVQDCDGIDSTYRWQSSVHDNLSDGTVLDFGTETGSTSINSMQIWNMLNLAWNHASTVGGRDPGFVDSCFPEGSGARWDRFWEEIDIPAADNDAPDVVTHEYGHAIMFYAYGSDNPSPGGSHSFGDDAQNASLAWSEGWGTGFMLSLRPDGRYNWSEGDTGQSIENFSDAGNRDGNRNEGRVAAAINDMLDSPNDNNGGNPDRGRADVGDNNTSSRVNLSTMINDTLWGSWHDDFEKFWGSLSGELSGTTFTNAREIMNYNYMDVNIPSSCVATKVVALESKSPDGLLDGLRRFRDHGLKGFNGGQQLINVYYRNSPELAYLLMKDKQLRSDAARIMQHVSKLGYLITTHEAQKKSAATRQVLIDRKMAAEIRDVISRLSKNASKELLADMQPLMAIVDSVEGLDLMSLQMKLKDIKSKHPREHKTQTRQFEFNDTSKKVINSEEVQGTLKKFGDRAARQRQ